ncbi:MAG TPA: wax ester/triacylglycerol synthase family O-acyltransferase [Roseiarcus sp.]|nr:wax ester/triacylglycerol synthase family O-acyltransferase [Roseiarcus sp.]
MNRLSLVDSLFLYLETPQTPMNIASLTIFTPASPVPKLFSRFREHTAARLDLLPSYRRRLEMTPLGLDHPVWVTEDSVDLDHHVRHAVLPKPGAMEQLRALVAELHAVPLDRARPLWEYHLIEGLEHGAFAVYIKMHHCDMDGIAGMSTLDAVYDFSPDGGPAPPPRKALGSSGEPADFLELTSTAIADFLRQGYRAVKSLPGAARTLAKAAPHFTRDARFLLGYATQMPRTPFNVAISPYRVYATCSLPLPEVKKLAKSRGATINDVVLALSAGALRRYLINHRALPDAPLIAGVPASLRAPGDARLNNQVMFSLSRLPTDVSGPLQRLTAARLAGQEAKGLFADVRDLLTTDISIVGAPLVITALGRLLARTRAYNVVRPFFNVVISNVPGPREPMYCAGAPARHYFPMSIPFHGCALNITVQSYVDQLDFGLVACSETVPDAQRIADYLAEDLEAMRKADAASSRPDAIETIAREAARPRGPGAEASGSMPRPDSALARNIDALSRASEAVARKLRRRTADSVSPKTGVGKSEAAARKRKAGSAGDALERRPSGERPAVHLAAPAHKTARKRGCPSPQAPRRKRRAPNGGKRS